MHASFEGTILLLTALIASACRHVEPSEYRLRSPDNRIEVTIRCGDRLRYDVQFNGKALLLDSTLSIRIETDTLGLNPKVKAAAERRHDQWIEPAVRQKAATIRENYRELRLEMENNYAVVFRAYDEGVAYRIETSLPQNEVKVHDEEVSLNFAGNLRVYYPQEESLFSHNERHFIPRPLNEIASGAIASVPAVVDADGTKIAIADSDVEDYPGLWLRGSRGPGLAGFFPPFPLKEKLERDRDSKITQSANYIAVTKGTRTYPWRLLGIAAKDASLITNSLVYLLAKPSQLQDTSWIRPGKAVWDWWSANNVSGVDFKAGVNTQTYKYYIDFAAKYGLEYVVLDEGWYELGNVLDVVPALDMGALAAYARQKNVGLILWVIWKALDERLTEALDQFQRWGIRGIKVDFMQRDDQPMVDFFHRVCREAARRQMLVDLHGAIRPATLTRTWPNLITNEGVMGLEWCKWNAEADPEHNVTLPFTRMFLGPMDYTPGAMVNATKENFAPIAGHPMSLGTRCHQLAMYVVFESPLQMLADNASHYAREPETMQFLSPVPSVWDETKVLDGRIGDYVLVARRSGRDWYVGAMTDWTARELELDLSFLPAGPFRMDAYEDGVNAGLNGSDYRTTSRPVSHGTKINIAMAPGGGWAARIYP
jgi:alpha-glucosidase